MLDWELGRTEDAEGSRRAGPVVLLREHHRRLVQALTLSAGCGRDLRRPDPFEFGEQLRDLFRRRGDRAFVDVAYLHRIVSSWSPKGYGTPGSRSAVGDRAPSGMYASNIGMSSDL